MIIRDNFGNSGSGVYNIASLAVRDSTIADNRAAFTSGGGITNNGVSATATIDRSLIVDNVAASLGKGGGIINIDGLLTVTDTSIAGNRGESGGGIYALSSGSVDIIRSTISGNIANYISTPGYGGGLYALGGTFTIENSTFSGNDAKTQGGAIRGTGPLDINNTTIAYNVAPDTGVCFLGERHWHGREYHYRQQHRCPVQCKQRDARVQRLQPHLRCDVWLYVDRRHGEHGPASWED